MTWHLRNDGHLVNEKRIRRLMRLMGLMPIYQKPDTSRPAKGQKTYPYLLIGLRVDRPRQVWCSDITYLPMRRGFLDVNAKRKRHPVCKAQLSPGQRAEQPARPETSLNRRSGRCAVRLQVGAVDHDGLAIGPGRARSTKIRANTPMRDQRTNRL